MRVMREPPDLDRQPPYRSHICSTVTGAVNV